MAVGDLDFLANSLSYIRNKRMQYSEKLASAGAEAPWSDKSSSQIDVSIKSTNQIQRLEGFEKGNKLVESRLKTQLLVLDDFMKLAKEIHHEFMPGSYTLGGVKPGLASTQQNYIDKFFSIGNKIDPVSGEYAMGGIATQNSPIVSFPSPTNGNGLAEISGIVHGPKEYSTPVSGAITIYINDAGDTISFTGNDFSAEVADLYSAIFQLCNSTTGADPASDQASATAGKAYKSLLSTYYQQLAQLNTVMEYDEELSDLIGQAISLRENVTEDRVEKLLSQVTTMSVIEDIQQYLFAQQSRKIQEASEILKRG